MDYRHGLGSAYYSPVDIRAELVKFLYILEIDIPGPPVLRLFGRGL
jgi:hypothetical protein